MSKFFVGQRVRILRSENWPELAGSEGRIIGFAVPDKRNSPNSEIDVAPDSWASNAAPYRGREGYTHFCPNRSQLEPILPEGHKPSEFSFSELIDNLGVVVA